MCCYAKYFPELSATMSNKFCPRCPSDTVVFIQGNYGGTFDITSTIISLCVKWLCLEIVFYVSSIKQVNTYLTYDILYSFCNFCVLLSEFSMVLNFSEIRFALFTRNCVNKMFFLPVLFGGLFLLLKFEVSFVWK